MSTRIVATACVLALMLGCSTDDPPFKPKPVQYNIYATVSNWWGDETFSTLHIYDADSLTQLDSLMLPNIALWAEASPDGQYLYIGFWSYKVAIPDYLAKIDLTNGSMLWTRDVETISPATSFRLMDNGRLIFYRQDVIDATTGETARHIEDSVFEHWKLFHGPRFAREVAAVSIDTVENRGWDSMVVAMDLSTSNRRGSFVPRVEAGQPPMGPENAVLHPDGRRVLCVGAVYDVQNAWFVVGDLETGEQLMAARLSTPSGEIAISADGTLAVVVDKANAAFGYGWPAVYVYDLVNYQHLKTFDPRYDLLYWPGQVRFLPGDRRIVIAPDNGFTGVGWLQTFDLQSMTSEFVVDTPFFEPFMGGLAVGPRFNQQ